MKKALLVFTPIALALLACSPAYALKTAPAPDLTKLDIAHVLQQLESTVVQSDGQDPAPIQVVAQFLQLQPPQISTLEQLLQARQATLVPLFQTAQNLTQQLAVALNSGAKPSQVGALLIQIHALQQQMGQVQHSFLTQFIALLNPDQVQKLQAIQIAVQVQPVLPAFGSIFLF